MSPKGRGVSVRDQLRQVHEVWRGRSSHPIYRRERGEWGQPNPLYERLMRLAPLILLLVLIFSACGYTINQAYFIGSNELNGLYCLLCLPGVLLRFLSLYGAVTAPALTAPSIGREVAAGTWESLRVTPYGDTELVAAKFFGAMSRIAGWRLMLLLAPMVGLLSFFFGLSATAGVLAAGLAALGAAAGPPLSVVFAGLLGLAVSLRVGNATSALALTYGGLLLFRFANGDVLWALAGQEFGAIFVGTSAGPALGYLAACAVLTLTILRQVRRQAHAA